MTDPWRNRARRAVESRLREGLRTNGDPRPHYVICGQDALAFHLVQTLLGNEVQAGAVRVTVIVPHQRRLDGPEIREIRGIELIKADRLDEETFRAAGLAGARGLALLHQDDVGNLHAALCAQEVEPHLRVVMRMFNTSLANGVRQLFPDCAVLSDASMAAPAFVAAALGEVAPTHFRHGGRTLYVARRSEVSPQRLVCGLADTRERTNVRVLPDDEDDADLVLAEAAGQPAGPEAAAQRMVKKRRRRVVLRALRSFATRKIGMATLVVLGIVVVFGALLAPAQHVSVWEGLYLTLVITISGADPDPDKEAFAQVMQVVLNLAGLALIPLITAAVVDGMVNARLALTAGRLLTERQGHVIVVGLGNVGTRVMWQLHDLGVEVVAADRDPNARGAAIARRLGIPLIIGDAALEDTLRAASVATCQALVVVTTDDVSNLQAALNGRAANGKLRVVLRLFDGDFAVRIQRAFSLDISRSVSYLAAPSFAAALVDRAVIATIPIDRHVLLVAEVPVAPGAPLAGGELAAVSQPQGVRVLALTRAGQPRPIWSPSLDERVQGGDRLTVVVRRAGLSWLLKQASPPPAIPAQPDGPPEPPAATPADR